MIESYVLFKVSSGSERDVCKQITSFNEVLVADIIYGEYDIIAKVAIPNLEELETFLSEKIRKVPSVILTSTMIIARKFKGIKHRSKK